MAYVIDKINRVLTVKDVIEKLQKLPPTLEIWKENDESGECYPMSEFDFMDRVYRQGWLKPSLIKKIKRVNVFRYEIVDMSRKNEKCKNVLII